MSWDILVLDKHKRFKTGDEFLGWYYQVMKWDEDIDYNDYRHATPSLQSWFLEMKDIARPMNGEFAPPDDEIDSGDYKEADYSIARDCIYVAFAWSDAESVYPLVKELAQKHDVAFFDVSGNGEVIYPDGTVLIPSESQEDVETDFIKKILQPSKEDFEKERKRRHWISTGIIVLYCLCFMAVLFVLIQMGFLHSVGRYLGVFGFIGFFVLLYFLSEWVYKADDAVRNKFNSGAETMESKSRETGDYTSEPKETVVDDNIVLRYPKSSAQLQAIIDRVPSTRVVLYYRAMQRGINKEWKSWACEMMEAGFSKPSIVQLAGEDLTMNPFEFSALVESIFKELAVDCPPIIAYSQYALGIAHKVQEGEITAERGFAILSDAAIDTDYHDALSEFYFLEENAQLLRDHLEGCYGDGNMREDNIEEWMALYFKKLIEANEIIMDGSPISFTKVKGGESNSNG